jgi:hypothetical protein
MTTDIGFSLCWFEQRGNDPHGGGFASPVGPNESEQVTLLQFQIDIINGEHITVFFCESDCFYQRSSLFK